MVNNLARSCKVVVFAIEINIVCLKSQSIITRIMPKLDEKRSFLI